MSSTPPPTPPPAFAGFTTAAGDFFEQLAVHNTRTWWQAHREDYERDVRTPMRGLLAELEGEFGPARMFRPNRDVRFGKDKSPYKTHLGAIVQVEDAMGYYVEISARGLLVAGGWYSPVGPQISRFRAAVDSPAAAPLEEGLARLRRSRPPYLVEGAPLKTRPRGVPADHPRLELMRCTQLILRRDYGMPAWVGSRKVVEVVRRDWRAMAPVVEWLADHVGPGLDPGCD